MDIILIFKPNRHSPYFHSFLDLFCSTPNSMNSNDCVWRCSLFFSPPSFTARGFEKNPVIFLIEAGQWMWPAVRVGFQQNVTELPGVSLKTLALRPVIFEVQNFMTHQVTPRWKMLEKESGIVVNAGNGEAIWMERLVVLLQNCNMLMLYTFCIEPISYITQTCIHRPFLGIVWNPECFASSCPQTGSIWPWNIDMSHKMEKESAVCTCWQLLKDTVDGRNPAPPGMYKTM